MASSIFRGFGVQTNQANTWTANQTFSGRILISDGLVGAPSLAYINNPLTGFYNEGANVLSITNNGTRYHRFGIGSYLLLADSAVIALGLSSDVTMTRAAARVLTLGPTTGVRLDWSTDSRLRVSKFGGTNPFDISLNTWGPKLTSENVSFADTDIVFIGVRATVGKLDLVYNEVGAVASFILRGTVNSAVVMSDVVGVFSAVKNTAARINVYYDAAGASGEGYYVQNLRGSTINLKMYLFGI
jgi:hypothetical protein